MSFVLKILIAVSVVGLLRSSQTFRRMSAELDEAAYLSLMKIMRATEESGYQPETVPLLIILSTIAFMTMMAALNPLGH